MDTQKEISNRLVEHYSIMLPRSNFKVKWRDDVADIEFQSPNKELKAVVSSQEQEISLFFEDPNHKTVWHTHMSLFGANEVPEQISKSFELMDGFLKDDLKIVKSSKYGFWMWDESNGDRNYSDDDETISITVWSEL